MFYLNVGGQIKAFASYEEYQKAAIAQAAISYPDFPLITLSEESAMHVLQRDGEPCPEIDGLTEPALYRILVSSPLGNSIGLLEVSIQSGKVIQVFHTADTYINRGQVDGAWEPWGIVFFYSKQAD